MVLSLTSNDLRRPLFVVTYLHYEQRDGPKSTAVPFISDNKGGITDVDFFTNREGDIMYLAYSLDDMPLF